MERDKIWKIKDVKNKIFGIYFFTSNLRRKQISGFPINIWHFIIEKAQKYFFLCFD